MDILHLSKFELHIITMCYVQYIQLHPSDDVPSQQGREAIADKLAAFLRQLPTDVQLTLSQQEE